jgi:hypothetical protein
MIFGCIFTNEFFAQYSQPGHKSRLLSVCHQIRTEALEAFLKPSPGFPMFVQLARWVKHGYSLNPCLLHFIKSISVHCLQGEKAVPGQGRKDTVIKTSYTLNQYPVHEVLSKLPRLESLTIIFSLIADNREAVEDVMDIATEACSELRQLHFFGPFTSLKFLRSFQNLHSLAFSGYSISSPEELLDILRNLPKINTLILRRYPDWSLKMQSDAYQNLMQNISFTPDVLRNMRPLKRIEFVHSSWRDPTDHITEEMMSALQVHFASMEALSIWSDAVCHPDTLEGIMNFVTKSKLKCLNLSLYLPPGIEATEICKRIPPTVESISLALHDFDAKTQRSRSYSDRKRLII